MRDKPVDHQRGLQTGSDRNYSSEEDSNLCDRPVTETATAGDGQDSLDPNNTEYWYNVNLLARQAMTGNDGTLSDDNYPDIVKNIVRTARMTMRAWDEHDALPVEQHTGCEMPGCQCNGRVKFMVRGSEDMTETDDSEWEDPADRDNRSDMMSNNYNLSEGMAPRTSTPPLRRNRRRRYVIRKKYETDIEDSIGDTSDDDFFTDEEWPISEHMVLPRMAADNVNRTVRNRNNNRGRWSWPGSENDITSDENYNQVDRPVTELATAGAGIENDSFGVEHVKCGEIPVTKLIPVRVLDTEEPLIMRVSTITSEISEVETSAYSETDINDIPVLKECVSPERRRREQLSACADTQLVMSDYTRGVTDYCFGVCEKTDSINRSGIGWCWDCLGLVIVGLSCFMFGDHCHQRPIIRD